MKKLLILLLFVVTFVFSTMVFASCEPIKDNADGVSAVTEDSSSYDPGEPFSQSSAEESSQSSRQGVDPVTDGGNYNFN